MFHLADWPIRRKLTFLCAIGALTSAILAAISFAAYHLHTLREEELERVTALGQMIAANAIAPLEADDPDTVTRLLGTLGYQPSVEAASIQGTDATLLATYPATVSADDFPNTESGTSPRITEDGFVVVAETIQHDGQTLGTVHIRCNLDNIDQQFSQLVWIALIVTAIALGIAMVITNRLQRHFTAPIQRLVSVIEHITGGGEISVNVTHNGTDELGVLCAGFNRMIEQIHAAQSELKHANAVMEDRIAERTAELRSEIAERKQAENARQKAQEFLETALGQSPLGIVIADAPNVTMRLINQTALNLRGGDDRLFKSADTTLTADHWPTFHPDGTPYSLDDLPLARAVKHGELVQNEDVIMRDQSGNDYWISMNASPIRDGDGRVTAGIVVFNDITKRKNAEEALEKTHRELLQVSRLAGMSEVATGVIHSVGNVLNSVNVAADRICHKLRNSRVTDLQQAGDIIAPHVDDMASFVSEHPQGQHMARYIIEIGKHLVAEQNAIIEDLQDLSRNIEHIKEIVAMQQTYARVSGVAEEVSMQEMIEDALWMRSTSFSRHGIAISRNFDDVPPILGERHKIVQIILNLISNAGHAIAEQRRGGGIITLRLQTTDDENLRLDVTDNGVGISADNLSRIFSYGFTTKQNGHGFGLHSSALAAKEMGGRLSAHSNGAGTGATFTLELPVHTQTTLEVTPCYAV